MKTLIKIGVLLLMIGLMFAAFVLPKYVQRTEPPMPEEDLAAALAAVDLEDEDAGPGKPTDSTESPESSLRSEKELAAFYAALDKEDFVTSSDELVRLSSELDAEVIDQLTVEMEEAVKTMGITEPAPVEIAAITPDPEPLAMLPLESTASIEASPASPEVSEPESKSTPPAVAPGEVISFFSLVQSGDFETAKSELARIGKVADAATVSSMKAALSSAQAKEKALLASQEDLKKSQEEMARIQKESVSQIQESVKQLAEVTKAAREATAEASRLKDELSSTPATPEAATAKKPAKRPPVKLPATQSIAFGFDSTFLNDASKALLAKDVIEALKKEEQLSVQLRGHADSTGPSDYNGILAQARCEIVKDFLLEKGIDSDRISLVSFGETQAASTGGSSEALRRVDVIFRPR